MTVRYESHPNRPLRDHLLEVAEGAKARLDHPALRYRKLLRELAWLIGLSHDVGKYTSYFQALLHAGKYFKGRLERHAFLGALFAAWLVFQRLPTLPEAPNKEFLPLLAYLVVDRHHGDLRSPRELIPKSRELKRWPDLGNITGERRRALEAFEHQFADLLTHRGEILRELDILPETSEFLTSSFDLYKLFHDLDKLRYRLEKEPGENGALSQEEGARLCLWGHLLFSALIDADKFSAAELSLNSRPSLPPDLVKRFLQAQYPEPRHELDRHRAAFHQEVRGRVEALKPEEIPGQILSLTAPTGMGKTFAALDGALRLREKLQRLWGVAPRIIYALPFVNIIEQNHEVFHEVLTQQLGEAYEREPERFLLRHHYLAEVTYRKENEALPVEKALLMTEAWESEIVVTTFVQLFQTLLGYKNRFLKKLHNLIGAIVILDEVQALPIEYWPLTANVFETLCRELGLVVLQMTATRPLIFPKVQELHPRPRALFTIQKRTRMHITAEDQPPEAWAKRVVEIFKAHGSVLAVVNTIGKSLEIYKLLRDKTHSHPFGLKAPESDPWLVYLSTNITPAQRQKRLEALKVHIQKGGQALVVSTQVVEAGVDIDFPAVVRDLGPLDSIVQVAGRCNREGNLDQGHVYVFPLREGGCARVYGGVHAYVTRRLLEGREQLDELAYADFVEQYFKEVQERISKETSVELWRAYYRLKYDHFEEPALSDFHLIESPNQVPIFVAFTTEDERWLMEEFKPEVLIEKDIKKRRAAYLEHRKRLHDSMIHPLLQRAAQNLPPAVADQGSLRWIRHRQLEEYYDLETGFQWQESEMAAAWVL